MTQFALLTELPKLWDDLALRPYLSEVSRRHGVVDALALPNMHDLAPIRIERLYVHPRLATSSVSAATPQENWPEGESLFGALQAAPCLVLLGDPGSGKTTLTNWLAWRLASGLVTSLPPPLAERVPIPCVLREMPASAFASDVSVADLAVLVATRMLGDKADASTKASLRARVDAKQYVLILDGIDEINVTHRAIVAGWIKQAALDGACVVATSRIVGYEDFPVDRPFEPPASNDSDSALEDEYRLHMRAPSCADEDAEKQAQRWAQIRFLMPFDQPRIASFVENWYLQRSGSEHEAAQKSRDFLDALSRSEFMQELARTPNLLSLMAIVYRERAYLPDGKALLYKEIANAYINTIDRQRKIEDNALAPYTWEVREGWLAFVGFQMQLERERNEALAFELKMKEIAAREGEIVPDRPQIEPGDSGLLVSEKTILNWLAQAMEASNVAHPQDRAKDFLGWVTRRSGLLLPRGDGRYAFVHLSFQEYFCARYLAGRVMSPAFIKNKQSDDAPVTKKKLFTWSNTALWRESLVYLLELISGERDADWVEDLLEILFESVTSKVDLSRLRAKLFARILSDRHIHVTPASKSALARRCAYAVLLESRSGRILTDDSTLAALVRAHHAIIVTPSAANPDERFIGLPRYDQNELKDMRDVENVYILLARGANIEDIAPVARFRNLQFLDLSQSRVTDISELAGLHSLRHLYLNDTKVNNISALGALRDLRDLNLSRSKVNDISPLASAVSLEDLDIGNTPVQDIAALAPLVNLTYLNLSNSSVTDIAALKDLKKLSFLFLNKTSIAEITALRNAKRLQLLELSDTAVTDISPLSALLLLRRLTIRRTPVRDISSLSHLKHLSIVQ
jgi:hypothetical protein